MLRREFIQAVAGFASASAVVRSWCASDEAADIESRYATVACGCGEPMPDEIEKAAESRSLFERTIISCLRDGSLRCLGVEGSATGYDATFVPHAGHESPIERQRVENVLALYDRGVVYISGVTVLNNYSGVRVFFGICA